MTQVGRYTHTEGDCWGISVLSWHQYFISLYVQQRTEEVRRVHKGYLERLTRTDFTLRLTQGIAKPQEMHRSVKQFSRPVKNPATKQPDESIGDVWLYLLPSDRIPWWWQADMKGLDLFAGNQKEPWKWASRLCDKRFIQARTFKPTVFSLWFPFQRHKNVVSAGRFLLLLQLNMQNKCI